VPGSADLIEGFKAIDRHAPDYLRADAYATGVIPERFATAKIQERLKGSGDRYRFRLARKPITALTNRVGISSITSSKGGTVDTRIELIRKANDMDSQEPFLIERAATYGDAYLFVWPVDEPEDSDDEDEIVSPTERLLYEAGVELAYQSPLNCRAMYDGEDGRRMRYVIRRWQETTPLGEKVWYAEVYYLGRMEAWVCDAGASGLDALQWNPYAEDESGQPVPATSDNWPITYEHGQIPIRHFRTAIPYGRPQHIDAYGPQDAITKAIVTQVSDLEAHGYPERARLVDEAASQDTARDTVDWGDDRKAPAANRQTAQPGGPGTERILRATKDVIQFPSPDPAEITKVLEQWIPLMASATDTPAWEFDPATGQQLSGIARWYAEAPLRDREKVFKRYLLGFIRETYALALEMVDIEAGDLDVTWTPRDVASDPDWWSVAAVREGMGVPREEILSEAGYLPEKVTQFLDAKADERFWGERVGVLTALAEALNQLSGPVSLGIIDAAKAAALVDSIMKDAGEKPIGGDGKKDEPEQPKVIPGQVVPPAKVVPE
jgi:hypothetical protein